MTSRRCTKGPYACGRTVANYDRRPSKHKNPPDIMQRVMNRGVAVGYRYETGVVGHDGGGAGRLRRDAASSCVAL